MSELTVLNVLLYGETIGTLTLLPGDQTLFSFTQSYIDNPNRSTLSLSFKNTLGNLITTIKPVHSKLPPFFSNLLPEGPLRTYLAKRARVKPEREFFLLKILGSDLPGAISITPYEEAPDWRVPALETHNQPQSQALRFSLAGVQLKFSALRAATGGLVIPTKGIGGDWIIKLPSLHFEGVPENEYSMMKLAQMMGMDIPDVQLVSLEQVDGLPDNIGKLKGPALAVRRFDRTSTQQLIHMEDFAQVFGVFAHEKYDRASYKNIAEVIFSETGSDGLTEFMRRLVYSILIGNADMHLKNWSLIYPDRRTPALSPAYDLVSTIPYIDDNEMALKFIRTKKMYTLSKEELTYFAAKAKLPEKLVLTTAAETVHRFQTVWHQEKQHLSLSTDIIDVIEAHLLKIPFIKET